MTSPAESISLSEAWSAIKARRPFIVWFTALLVLAVFVFSLFSAGGVNGSFTALVSRQQPVEPSANQFDKEYDTFFALRSAEAVTKMLVVTLRDPVFQASFPHSGQISARVLAPQIFKVSISKAKDEAALNGTSEAVVAALNERLNLMAGNEPINFRVQAADFEGHENRPQFWPDLFVALLAGLGFSTVFAVLRRQKI